MKKYLIIILALVSITMDLKAQRADNTKPMYGEVPKGPELVEIDEEFKSGCMEQYGTLDSASKVHVNHGWRYFYNNDLATAMKRFNQAWMLNAENPDSYFGFAALLEMQKNTTEAERFYAMGKQKDITNTRAEKCYQRIADCKEQLGDINGASEAYRKIIELKPGSSFPYKKLGYFQMSEGKSQEALQSFNKAIDLDPDDPMTYNNRGNLYQMEKQYDKAIIDFNKAIELNSNYISAYVNLGITRLQMGDNKAAEADFKISVEKDDQAGELWRLLGISRLNQDNKKDACKDFRKGVKLGDAESAALLEEYCK